MAAAALVAAALALPFLVDRTAHYYTDGDRIRAERGHVERDVRSVLWEPPAALDALNDPERADYEPCVDPFGELLVFTRGRPGEDADLWLARRERGRWGAPARLDAIDTDADELGAAFSADSRWLYFYSNRDGGLGGYDIWASPREGDAWGEPVHLGPAVNTSWNEMSPAPGPEGRVLYFTSDRRPDRPRAPRWTGTIRARLEAADYDVYVAELGAAALPEDANEADSAPAHDLTYAPARPVAALNQAGWAEGTVSLAPFGDFLYFSSNRPGGEGGFDIYRARISSRGLGEPESLGPQVNSPADELDPALTTGGYEIVFSREHRGQDDLFSAVSREVYLTRESEGPYWSFGALLELLARLVREVPPVLLGILLSLLVCAVLLLAFRRWLRAPGVLARCFLIALLLHLLAVMWMNRHEVERLLLEVIDAGESYAPVEIGLEATPEESIGLAIRQASARTPRDAPPELEIEIEARRASAPPRAQEPAPVELQDPGDELELPPLERERPRPELSAPAHRQETETVAAPPEIPEVASSPAPELRKRRLEAPPDPAARQEAEALDLERRPLRPERPPPAHSTGVALAPPVKPRAVEAPPPHAARARDVETPPAPYPLPEPPPPAEAADSSAAPEIAARPAAPLPPESEPLELDGDAPLDVALHPAAPRRVLRRDTGSHPESTQVPFEEAAVDAGALAGTRPNAPHRPAPRLPADDAPTDPEAIEAPGRLPPQDPPAAPEIAARAAPLSGTPQPAESRDEESAGLQARSQPVAPVAPRTRAPVRHEALDLLSPRPVPLAGGRAGARREPVATAAALAPVHPVRETALGPLVPAPSRAESGSAFRPRIYRLREQDRRDGALLAGGGSHATERAVAAGLAWLALHQSPDGRWTLDRYHTHLEGASERDLVHPDWNGRSWTRSLGGNGRAAGGDTAATGLALLAFLGHGDTHSGEGPYREVVERGLRWLLSAQRPDGDLRGEGNMYMHGIAAFALAEAYAFTRDPRLRAPAQRAIDFTVKSQVPQKGGWRYEPYPASSDVDTSVFGWMLMALKSGLLGGLDVDATCLRRADAYLRSAAKRGELGLYTYQPGQGTKRTDLAMTAQGFFSQKILADTLLAEEERTAPALRRQAEGSVRFLMRNLPRAGDMDGVNFYYWYYGTLALFQEGGPAWETWNERLQSVLLSTQLGEEHGTARGSWDPRGHRAEMGGRLYSTALSILCLEVYYRYAPLEER